MSLSPYDAGGFNGQRPYDAQRADQELRYQQLELAATLYADYELRRIRAAQEESLAIQRQSLRLQRAQTMLMAGWTVEQIDAQFDREDA